MKTIFEEKYSHAFISFRCTNITLLLTLYAFALLFFLQNQGTREIKAIGDTLKDSFQAKQTRSFTMESIKVCIVLIQF